MRARSAGQKQLLVMLVRIHHLHREDAHALQRSQRIVDLVLVCENVVKRRVLRRAHAHDRLTSPHSPPPHSHERSRTTRQNLLDFEVVALHVVHRCDDLQARLVVHAQLRLTAHSQPHVERLAHGVSADVVARLQNGVAHHSTADRVQPRRADVLRITARTGAHASAEAGERDDGGERVGAVVQRVRVQHVAVVLLGQPVGPLGVRRTFKSYGVDPELDDDRAGDRADADRVQEEVVLRVVHQRRVGHGGHFRGGGARFQEGGIHHGRVDHDHEEIVGVDENGARGADEHAAHSHAGQLGVKRRGKEDGFNLAVAEHPLLVGRSSADADAREGHEIDDHGRQRMGSIGDDRCGIEKPPHASLHRGHENIHPQAPVRNLLRLLLLLQLPLRHLRLVAVVLETGESVLERERWEENVP